MDLGDQHTNVLSCNNFASIAYEYFETQWQTPSFTTTKRHLQDVETVWRKHGALVYYDAKREGIWVFQQGTNSPNRPFNEGDNLPNEANLPVVPGIELVKKDQGAYEPSSLAKNKFGMMPNTLTTSNSTSSPSPLEIRNAQHANARAMQANAAQNIYEPAASSPGVKSATSLSETLTFLKEIHEHFISSVQGSIVYKLCSDHGFIPLNSRTLLFPSESTLKSMAYGQSPKVSDNTVTLVNLDISLTLKGTLMIKACSFVTPGPESISLSNPEKLQSILYQGAELWLAPGGNPAKFYSFYDDEQMPGIQPISDLQKYPEDHSWRFHGTTIRSWQSRCLDWLSTKGFDPITIEQGGWLFVQVLNTNYAFSNPEYSDIPSSDDGAIVPWPALLCFRTIKTSSAEVQPSSANSFGLVDPLSFAEEWSMNADKRASVILTRQQEREALEAAKQQAEREAQNLRADAHSTALLEKGNNAGAMYPTPPDAIHHPGGPTPSFDGVATTPGNPGHLFPHDLETTNPGTSIMNTVDTDNWVTSEQKHRSTSNMNFGENDNDNDNLFGDMGGDLFGDTDITDADFNFFDQPDDIEMDLQPGSPVASSLAPSQQHNAVGKSPIPNKPLISQPGLVDTIMKDTQPIDNSILQPAFNQRVTTSSKDMDIEMSNNNGSFGSHAPPQSPPRIVAPFDKETVFGQLVKRTSKLSGGASIFDKVKFEYSLREINEKYGYNGRFRYSDDELKPQSIAQHDPTNPESLDRRKSENKPLGPDMLTRILNNDNEDYEFELENEAELEMAIDSNSASNASESDEPVPTGLSAMVRLGMKRKRYLDEVSVSSYNAFTGEYEPSAATPQSTIEPQIPIFESDPADWSLTPYFTSPEPDIQPTGLSDLDLIETAQIIADQAASGNLRVHDQSLQNPDAHAHAISSTRALMTGILKATKACLKDIERCTVRSYLDIQGIPVLNQPLRLPPRPMPNPRAAQNTDLLKASNLYLIQPPQLEVRRGDSKLAVLPPAIHFWDNLGLAPFTGNKDVNAICIHPDIAGISENADIFLDQMRGAYESFRFGGHDRIVFPGSPSSLIHYPFDGNNQRNVNTNNAVYLSSLKDIMAQLSENLSSMTIEEKNIVVYFVYPVDNSSVLVQICAAFKHLFKFYRKSLSGKKLKAVNELVLQLVPLNFMAAPSSLVVPSPVEYSRLAMEVYDRCVDFASSSTTAAILLERPLPRSIDFKLVVNPSPALLQENSCLHIAYAQSLDERWITAAWSDNRGTKQMTASYCLGRKNEPFSLLFTDVANEIWETTLGMISRKKVQWRIIIAKTAVMEQSEIDFWTGLASTESNAQISLTLVTVQTDPSLRILSPQTRIPPPSMTTSQSTTTPVSTPQASQSSIFSPDTPSRDSTTNALTPSEVQSTSTPTAPFEPDQNSRLVDITDQTWGAILSHRLNNSNSLLDDNPALISGYLIKNSGTSTEDPPIVVEVNIIHAEVVGNPRTFHDSLLREILGYYRGLATLARVRGVVHPVSDGRPWHVAAAEKAVKALYMLV